VLARTSLDAAALVRDMQRELRAVNITLPVISAKTMTQSLEESLLGPKAVATFLGVLGALGLCLAGIGLYAVVAFAVTRRSREIGIRMALGAQSQQVVWTVAREVAVLVGVGTGWGRSVAARDPGSASRRRPDAEISLYRPTAVRGDARDRRVHGVVGWRPPICPPGAQQDGSAGRSGTTDLRSPATHETVRSFWAVDTSPSRGILRRRTVRRRNGADRLPAPSLL
jgi:hypothetical protein